MEITAVRVRLAKSKDDKLKAYACVMLDECFVVRDVKVISHPGGLFVAMPSRKLLFSCQQCRTRNYLRAKYCNNCGSRLTAPAETLNGRGRAKLYADVAHPITPACRELFHKAVIAAYDQELARSSQPGYVPDRFDEDLEAAESDGGSPEDPGEED